MGSDPDCTVTLAVPMAVERSGSERSVASVDIVQLIVGSMQASRHVHRQVQGEQVDKAD